MDIFAAVCVGLHRNSRQLLLFWPPCQRQKSLIFSFKAGYEMTSSDLLPPHPHADAKKYGFILAHRVRVTD
jgi:hypothetical protein